MSALLPLASAERASLVKLLLSVATYGTEIAGFLSYHGQQI